LEEEMVRDERINGGFLTKGQYSEVERQLEVEKDELTQTEYRDAHAK
jgi:hypothetical protein